MKKILIVILFPSVIFSQEVSIKQLSTNINTSNAEINFIQTNDSTAYFTVVEEKNGKIESDIYITSFIDSIWAEKTYSSYSSEDFNTANISFLKGERTFLTICDNNMMNCKIVYLEKGINYIFHEILNFSNEKWFNTQPFFVKKDSQKVLYFVSDREGGFGGLDIWLSIIDANGNFGAPINAGNKINSKADEITPFYNKNNGKIYFSSNKKEGAGGFDVYSAEGSLNLWREPKNMAELNSNKDEMYLTFYNKNKGYFASNRTGAKFENTEYCCNDIFSFEYFSQSLEVINQEPKTHNYLPLELYFHNDEPDCCTMDSTTNKTYKDAYVSYFIMKPEYEKKNLNLNNFFEEKLQKNFNTLNKVLDLLLFDLSRGNEMELQIRGYASPLHKREYNQNLSKRRITSFINYLNQFNNGAFQKHIFSKKLIVKELSFGESASSKKVSDNPNDKNKSIYSVEAMLERKIEIVDVILKQKEGNDLNKGPR